MSRKRPVNEVYEEDDTAIKYDRDAKRRRKNYHVHYRDQSTSSGSVNTDINLEKQSNQHIFDNEEPHAFNDENPYPTPSPASSPSPQPQSRLRSNRQSTNIQSHRIYHRSGHGVRNYDHRNNGLRSRYRNTTMHPTQSIPQREPKQSVRRKQPTYHKRVHTQNTRNEFCFRGSFMTAYDLNCCDLWIWIFVAVFAGFIIRLILGIVTDILRPLAILYALSNSQSINSLYIVLAFIGHIAEFIVTSTTYGSWELMTFGYKTNNIAIGKLRCIPDQNFMDKGITKVLLWEWVLNLCTLNFYSFLGFAQKHRNAFYDENTGWYEGGKIDDRVHNESVREAFVHRAFTWNLSDRLWFIPGIILSIALELTIAKSYIVSMFGILISYPYWNWLVFAKNCHMIKIGRYRCRVRNNPESFLCVHAQAGTECKDI